jgi:hypothetical protein
MRQKSDAASILTERAASRRLMYTRGMLNASAARALAVSVTLSLCFGVAAPPAAAQDDGTRSAGRQRVAVVKLSFDGGVPEAARELFAQRLVEGLTAVQFEVLAGSTVRQRLAAAGVDVGDCRGGACLGRAAQALDVAFLVIGAVDEHDKTYDITLELVNGRSGATIGTNRERCEICGVEEASEKVGLAASALRGRLEALANTPARFIIRSRPAGARVSIDGAAAGRTPVDRELTGGVHKLELAADGYDSMERTVTAVNGVDETLDLDMVPLPTKFPYRNAGWAAVAAGVVALVAGIWAVGVDGDEIACGASARDDLGHCPTVRNTRGLGAALIGLGAASATLGGTWLYFSGIGAPRANEGSAPAAGVTVSGRF